MRKKLIYAALVSLFFLFSLAAVKVEDSAVKSNPASDDFLQAIAQYEFLRKKSNELPVERANLGASEYARRVYLRNQLDQDLAAAGEKLFVSRTITSESPQVKFSYSKADIGRKRFIFLLRLNFVYGQSQMDVEVPFSFLSGGKENLSNEEYNDLVGRLKDGKIRLRFDLVYSVRHISGNSYKITFDQLRLNNLDSGKLLQKAENLGSLTLKVDSFREEDIEAVKRWNSRYVNVVSSPSEAKYRSTGTDFGLTRTVEAMAKEHSDNLVSHARSRFDDEKRSEEKTLQELNSQQKDALVVADYFENARKELQKRASEPLGKVELTPYSELQKLAPEKTPPAKSTVPNNKYYKLGAGVWVAPLLNKRFEMFGNVKINLVPYKEKAVYLDVMAGISGSDFYLSFGAGMASPRDWGGFYYDWSAGIRIMLYGPKTDRKFFDICCPYAQVNMGWPIEVEIGSGSLALIPQVGLLLSAKSPGLIVAASCMF